VAVALTGVVAGKLSDRVAAGLLGGIGLAVMCLGLLALLTVDRSTPDGLMLSMFAVCGIGFGLFQSPNNRTMISAAPRERTGGASGMLGTARLTGQTVGASVVAMLMGFSGSPYALVLCFAAALAGAASLVSLSRLRY